ncbi:MAG: lipopolysaccharide biosynthesis protein [Terriglobales bacterium]
MTKRSEGRVGEEMPENLKQQATAGVQWQGATTAFQVIARLVVGVALARLLPPEDFGMVGFALIFTEFLTLFSELGVGAALVQRQEISPVHLRVGFTLSVLLGSVATLLLWWLAPRLATGTTLAAMQAVSLSLLLTSVGTVSTALLYRHLDFRRLFFVELISYLPGYALVTVALAARGYRVWSLVAGVLVQASLRLILLSGFAPHSRKPSFSAAETRDLLGFGVGMTLARLANYVARNVDYLVVGQFLGPTALGLYLRAYALGIGSTTQLTSLMTTVLFPLFARSQSDLARTKRWYLQANNLVSMVAVPILTLLALTAPEVLRGIYGPAWSAAAVPLQFFCVAAMFRCLNTLSDALVRAHAQVYRQFFRHLAYAALVSAGALAGLRWGISGAAAGVSLAVVVMFVLMSRLSLEVTRASWMELLATLRMGVVLGLGVGATCALTVWLLRSARTPDLLVVLVTGMVAGLTTLAGLRSLPASWCSEALSPLMVTFLPRRWLNWFLGPATGGPEKSDLAP